MKRKYLFIITLLYFLAPVLSFAGDLKTLMPNRPVGISSQQNVSNLTSRSFGVDKQGSTSILTPNHSGGYIGFDSHGNATIITPLRGNLGVDSHGNIWTIISK